jgi:hypothetical protein
MAEFLFDLDVLPQILRADVRRDGGEHESNAIYPQHPDPPME